MGRVKQNENKNKPTELESNTTLGPAQGRASHPLSCSLLIITQQISVAHIIVLFSAETRPVTSGSVPYDAVISGAFTDIRGKKGGVGGVWKGTAVELEAL